MADGTRATGRGVVLVLLAVLALAAGGAAGGYAGHAARRAEVPLPPLAVPSGETPADVAAALATPSPLPTATPGDPVAADDVAAALGTALADPRLGGSVHAEVVDLATGTSLFGQDTDVAVAPASTAKIVTAAAALTAYDPEERVTTSVVAGPVAGAVTLVGAGDPTLSAAAPGTATPYAGAARVSDLAARVTAALGGAAVTAVYVDGAAFTGPATATGWAPEDAPSEYGAPITAAMVDGGRDTPDADVRSADPDLAAGQALADALGVPDVPVSRTDTAPLPTTTVLGSVQSATVSEIVGEMLKESDNVLAEVLARLVAVREGQPASFAGATAAVRAEVPEVGGGMVDASGLSVDDRLTAADLTATLRRVATTPGLREIVTMLPVGGWDGTLADRYLVGGSVDGAGRVRAKTGTLSGVSCLAGVVVTASGRPLGFALLADAVVPTYDGTLQAEAALDAAATALTALG